MKGAVVGNFVIPKYVTDRGAVVRQPLGHIKKEWQSKLWLCFSPKAIAMFTVAILKQALDKPPNIIAHEKAFEFHA